MKNKKIEDIQKKIKEFKLRKTRNYVVNTQINAFNIAIDLVAGTITGVVAGLILDKLFDSRPLFLVIFLLVGILAGARIIWQKFNSNKHDL